MEIEVQTVEENPLMERKEVKTMVNHEGEATPTKEDVKSRFVADRGLSENQVTVLNVYGKYGRQSSQAEIYVEGEFDYDEEVDVPEEYVEAVSGTITEAKEAIEEMEDPDLEKALQAEKQNKSRKTLVEWIEERM